MSSDDFLVRGIVTPPGELSLNNNSVNARANFKPEEMLYLTLYWDKILIPTGMIHLATPFENDLISTGILSRPHSYKIKPMPEALEDRGLRGQIAHDLYAFGEFAKQKLDEPGEDWIIQHYSKNPVYLPVHRNEQNTIRLKITNVLPLPSPDGTFSIDDLLEFKLNRRSQLDELHYTMDTLLKRMYEEPVHALKESEFKRFENAVKELDKPLLERFKVIKKSDWEVSLSPDIPTIIEKTSAIAGAIAADQFHNLSFPIVSTFASIASMFSLSKQYGFTFNQYARDDIKLEYISGAKSKNLIK